ncbi:MAG: prepilin-type N-terminal cleavage/methylation domain-containing protein [Sphingopyxis sp.]|nr:prepilin-type N-terminal cleavage/methylation domain-containing protein [Sphingopyxis sp.]
MAATMTARTVGTQADGRQDGFTFVEVLVSLTVISVMSALIISASGQLRLLVEADKRLERQIVMQKTVRHMANLIADAERVHLVGSTPENPVYLRGNQDSATFTVVSSRGAFVGGLNEVSFKIERVKEARVLVQVMALRRTAQTQESIQTIELLDNAPLLAFSYLGLKDGQDQVRWHQDWDQGQRLPKAVRVELTESFVQRSITASAAVRIDLAD